MNFPTVRGEPFIIPRGMKNMSATMCSKPRATNVQIGRWIEMILEMLSREEAASQQARATSLWVWLAVISSG